MVLDIKTNSGEVTYFLGDKIKEDNDYDFYKPNSCISYWVRKFDDRIEITTKYVDYDEESLSTNTYYYSDCEISYREKY